MKCSSCVLCSVIRSFVCAFVYILERSLGACIGNWRGGAPNATHRFTVSTVVDWFIDVFNMLVR